jgi:Tol biopolymer transport system component/DNA-binding winged helix-turn-helix (wHTH) protein
VGWVLQQDQTDTKVIRFATFEIDLRSEELRKGGVKIKLGGQPFQVLAVLLEQPGEVVTREELQRRLWPDSFVDFDHGLNAAINKIREALSDTAENPRFVETVPRRGYRFIGSVEASSRAGLKPVIVEGRTVAPPKRLRVLALAMSLLAVLSAYLFLLLARKSTSSSAQHALTRLTQNEGLQIGATWSPDGKFIAYSSDQGGKFDIWVWLVSGGDPVQITTGPGNNWQPDWSPDGKNIVYRSEHGGGLFVMPALGGEGQARRITSFGYYPRWSPDGTQVLFRTHLSEFGITNRFFLVDANGGEPHEVFADLLAQNHLSSDAAAWHPDGKRLSLLVYDPYYHVNLWTVNLSDGKVVQSRISPAVASQFAEASLPTVNEFTSAAKLSWSPTGNAVYFDRVYRGARNLWKMTMEPTSLTAVSAERLTTGAGRDLQSEVSPDGKELLFTTQSRHVRAWLYPFDASTGRITGPGKSVTQSGLDAWLPNISRDGKKLAYSVNIGDTSQLWCKLLPDGPEIRLPGTTSFQGFGVWSPDATRMVYRTVSHGEWQLVVWSSATGDEQRFGPIVHGNQLDLEPYDWSPDGKSVLASIGTSEDRVDIWSIPVDISQSGSTANSNPRKIISNSDSALYQGHFSPDGRWIAFISCKNERSFLCTLFVTPTAGGAWTNLSDSPFFDDKPRWAPDGKAIYYVSGRGGVYNVRGIRFDPMKGKKLGESFPVTSFADPGPIISHNITAVELTTAQHSLVITLEESSGSIWALDNVDR